MLQGMSRAGPAAGRQRLPSPRIWAATQPLLHAAQSSLPHPQVRQAAASLKLQLQPLLSSKQPKATKGFGGGGGAGGDAAGNRFSVELPVADTSPAATARLAQEVLTLAGMPTGGKGGCLVVFASAEAAKAAATALGGGAQALELRAACQAEALGGPLLLVAPGIADVSLACGACMHLWQYTTVLAVGACVQHLCNRALDCDAVAPPAPMHVTAHRPCDP